MYTKNNRWTPEEEELLNLGLYPTELAKHPLMIANGRTRAAIDDKIKRQREKAAAIRRNPGHRTDQPSASDAYDGRPVRPYQFISTREATPARKKVWDKEERALQTI